MPYCSRYTELSENVYRQNRIKLAWLQQPLKGAMRSKKSRVTSVTTWSHHVILPFTHPPLPSARPKGLNGPRWEPAYHKNPSIHFHSSNLLARGRITQGWASWKVKGKHGICCSCWTYCRPLRCAFIPFCDCYLISKCIPVMNNSWFSDEMQEEEY